MANRLLGLVSAVALASAMATSGCGSSGSSDAGAGGSSSGGAGNASSGGKSGGGGTVASGGAATGGAKASGGSGGSQANCSNVSPCAGNVPGTWAVTSSCLTLSGDWDVSLAGLGCPTVPVTGSLQVKANGTWTANADGTYTDKTTTTGSMTFPLKSSCLTVSSIPASCSNIGGAFSAFGWTTVCSTDANGQCNCSATANQTGGVGVISPYSSSTGNYTTSGSDLNTDSEVDYSYCVSQQTLTLTPKSTILPITGNVVLQQTGASPGSGGAGGASTGSGGAGGSTASAGGAKASGGSAGSGGRTGAAGSTAGTSGTSGTDGGTGTGPCDIYASANMKCVAAHSTIRALYGSYSGPLYQVTRASDKTTQDIPPLTPGGIADSSVQDTFCAGTTCGITKVYDQSGNGNFVEAETTTSEDASVRSQSTQMTVASATKEQLSVGGHKVYSLWMGTGQAYWRDGSKSNVPLGNSPQGVYMVTSGTHPNISGCCFDYGNGETSRTVAACGAMDAVNFSTNSQFGSQGAGSGPWVMADFECGLKAQGNGGTNNNSPSMTQAYVTAIEKNDGTSQFELRGADATTGTLTTFYQGKLPFTMQKQGAIVLGSGGDCCYSNATLSSGTFYEGAIVAGYPSDSTDEAVQTNIVGAGYGK